MPRVHGADKGGNGGVQLWGRSESRIKFFKKCNQWGEATAVAGLVGQQQWLQCPYQSSSVVR